MIVSFEEEMFDFEWLFGWIGWLVDWSIDWSFIDSLAGWNRDHLKCDWSRDFLKTFIHVYEELPFWLAYVVSHHNRKQQQQSTLHPQIGVIICWYTITY